MGRNVAVAGLVAFGCGALGVSWMWWVGYDQFLIALMAAR